MFIWPSEALAIITHGQQAVFCKGLDSLKNQIEKTIRQEGLKNPSIDTTIETGYEFESHLTFYLTGERPMNETELKREKQIEEQELVRKQAQYKELEAIFGKKSKNKNKEKKS